MKRSTLCACVICVKYLHLNVTLIIFKKIYNKDTSVSKQFENISDQAFLITMEVFSYLSSHFKVNEYKN